VRIHVLYVFSKKLQEVPFVAFLTSVKAGKKILLFRKYTGKTQTNQKGYEHCYNFGNENVALERLSLWMLDNSFIQKLIDLGISKEDVIKEKNKVLEAIQTQTAS
jgi:DNA relaxase NicK